MRRRKSDPPSGCGDYIIINRTDTRYGDALTLREFTGRQNRLHAVRGHLRRYRSGLIVQIPPHARGKGTALQIKDYILR